MGFWVYILKSEKDGRFYIGQTNNIEERLLVHNRGKVISTRNRRPFSLLACNEYDTRSEAVKIEKYVKSFKGGNGFKKLLKEWQDRGCQF